MLICSQINTEGRLSRGRPDSLATNLVYRRILTVSALFISWSHVC